MKIVESESLRTQKPQSGKVYESSKTARQDTVAGQPSTARNDAVAEDGVALNNLAQLQALAIAVGGGETSRVQRLMELVQSGQYQVDPTALSASIVASMIKGY